MPRACSQRAKGDDSPRAFSGMGAEMTAPNEHARLAPGAGTTEIRKHRKHTAVAEPMQSSHDALLGWFNLAKSSRPIERAWRRGRR